MLKIKDKLISQRSPTLEHAPAIELSFDDAPYEPEAVRQISETLRKQNIRCEFFSVGNLIKKQSDVIRMLHDSGHGVQNHSWSHIRLDFLTRGEVRQELEQTQEAIFETISVQPSKFRAPYGAGGWSRADAPLLWEELDRLHLENCSWDLDSEDWRTPKGVSSAKIEDIRLQIMRGFGRAHLVLLLHATSQTAHDLPELLDRIRSWNLTVVSSRSLCGVSPPPVLNTRKAALKALMRHREDRFESVWGAAESSFKRLKDRYERNLMFGLPDSLVATLVAGEDRRYLSHP